jgi:predicted RNase H-like HicB family nuclease
LKVINTIHRLKGIDSSVINKEIYMYRVGFPGWKLASKLGIPVRLRVNIHFDAEAQRYWADSPDLDGLIVEARTLDDLKDETLGAAGALLELQLHGKHPDARTKFMMESVVPA